MDPINQFQSKEADKLTNWVSQTLALKEAKVHTSDAMAAIGQRAQVQVETSEMPDTYTPPSGESDSRAELVSTGITEERVREIIEEMLEDYATKEWVEEKLQDYATKEWVEEQGYATEEWVEDQNYATEEWVNEQLEPYAQQDWVLDQLEGLATEEWVTDNFVHQDDFNSLWDDAFFGRTAVVEYIYEKADEVIDEYDWDSHPFEFASKPWVLDQLSSLTGNQGNFATEAWVTDNFVHQDDFIDLWDDAFYGRTGVADYIGEMADEVIEEKFENVSIQANCANGNVTVELLNWPY